MDENFPFSWVYSAPAKDLPLHTAAYTGDMDAVRQLLEDQQLDLDRGEPGTHATSLHRACAGHHTQVVQLLLQKPLNINAKTSDGSTALHVAAAFDAVNIIEVLLENPEVDVSNVDNDGNSPLITAIRQRCFNATKKLSECPNVSNVSQKFLHEAAKYSSPEIFQYLMDTFSLNINCADRDDATPIHLAAVGKNDELFQYLLQNQQIIDFQAVDKNGWKVIHYTAYYMSKALFEELLEIIGKNDINLADKKGRTPLLLAAYGKHSDTFAFLIERSEVQLKVADEEGWTVIHYAACYIKSEVRDEYEDQNLIFENLLKLMPDVDLDVADKKGRTPLHVAAFGNNYETLKYLIQQRGVDLNAVDNEGWTIIHYTAAYMLEEKGDKSDEPKNKKLFKALLDKMEDVNINVTDSDGRTPLHVAHYKANFEIIKILLRRPDIYGRILDNRGRSVLHYAADYGTANIMEYLVKYFPEIDVNIKDKDGTTPLQVAVKNKNTEVAQYLLHNPDIQVAIRDNKEWTTLHYAGAYGNVEIFQLLTKVELETEHWYITNDQILARTTKLLNQGANPLHLAISFQNVEMIKYLLDYDGIRTDAKDKQGWTILHYAVQNENCDILQNIIIQHIANDAKLKKIMELSVTDNKQRSLLHLAIKRKNFDTVRYLIDNKKISKVAADKYGFTLLHYAAQYGTVEMFEFLLDKIPELDINVRSTKNDKTPLHLAIVGKNIEMIKYLLAQKELKVELTDERGWNAMHFAAHNGNSQVLEVLDESKRHIDWNIAATDCSLPVHVANNEVLKELIQRDDVATDGRDNEGRTILHLASENGTDEILELILQKNINVNIVDESGRCPLHYAVNRDVHSQESLDVKLKAFECLMKQNEIKVNIKNNLGRTPLLEAARQNFTSGIELLLKHKDIDANLAENNGWTPLHMALYYGFSKSALLLLEHKNTEKARKEDAGITPLKLHKMKADTEKTTNRCSQLYEAIEEQKVDDVKDILGKEPIETKSNFDVVHKAVDVGNVEIVKTLLESDKIDPNFLTAYSVTPIQVAAYKGKKEVVKFLMRHPRVDVNAEDSLGGGALHRAVVGNQLEVIKLLLQEKRTEVFKVDKEGCNVLHRACQKGHEEVIEVLLKRKEGQELIKMVNKKGNTPLHDLYTNSESFEKVRHRQIEYFDQYVNLRNTDNESILSLALEDERKRLRVDAKNTTEENAQKDDEKHFLMAMLEKENIESNAEDLCRALDIDLQNLKKEAISLEVKKHMAKHCQLKLSRDHVMKEADEDDYKKFVKDYNFKNFVNLDAKFVFEYNYLSLLTSLVEEENVVLMKRFDVCNIFIRLQKPRLREINHVLHQLLPNSQFFRYQDNLNKLCFFAEEELKLKFSEGDKWWINRSFPLLCIILGKYKLVEEFFQHDTGNQYVLHCAFIMQILKALNDEIDFSLDDKKKVDKVIASIDHRMSFTIGKITSVNKFVSRRYVTEAIHSALGGKTILFACIESGAKELVHESACYSTINGLPQEAIDKGYKVNFNSTDFFYSLLRCLLYFPFCFIAMFLFLIRLCFVSSPTNESLKHLSYSKKNNDENSFCADSFLSKCVEYRYVDIIPSVRFLLDSLFFLTFLGMISYVVQRELLYIVTPLEAVIYTVYVTHAVEEFNQIIRLHKIETAKHQFLKSSDAAHSSDCINVTASTESDPLLTKRQVQDGGNINIPQNKVHNGLLKRYFSDHWNQFDMLFLIFMLIGLIFRIARTVTQPEHCKDASCEIRQANDSILYTARILFIVGLIFGYAKSLRLLSFYKKFGPKLIMIGKMIKLDLIPFFVIIMVFVFAFATAFAGAVFPNALTPETYNFTSHQRYRFSIEKGFKLAFYGLIGDFTTLGVADGDEPELTNEGPAHPASKFVIPYLFLFVYVLLMNILLLNLLIALFTKTYNDVERESKHHWYQMKLDLVEEYKIRSVLPPPFNIFDMMFRYFKRFNKFEHLSTANRIQRQKDVCLVFQFLQQEFFKSARRQRKRKIKRQLQTAKQDVSSDPSVSDVICNHCDKMCQT